MSNKKNDIKSQIKKKVPNIRTNDDNLERKDTMTDPANLALSSLIKDINKKIIPKNEEKNNRDKNDNEDDIITIIDEIENNYNLLKNNNKSETKIIEKK